MALGIVIHFYDRPSQPIGVIWFVVSLFEVSCRGPVNYQPPRTAGKTKEVTKNDRQDNTNIPKS